MNIGLNITPKGMPIAVGQPNWDTYARSLNPYMYNQFIDTLESYNGRVFTGSNILYEDSLLDRAMYWNTFGTAAHIPVGDLPFANTWIFIVKIADPALYSQRNLVTIRTRDTLSSYDLITIKTKPSTGGLTFTYASLESTPHDIDNVSVDKWIMIGMTFNIVPVTEFIVNLSAYTYINGVLVDSDEVVTGLGNLLGVTRLTLAGDLARAPHYPIVHEDFLWVQSADHTIHSAAHLAWWQSQLEIE